MINSTTGTSIENYFDWVRRELEIKEYGEVSITFTVTQGQVSLVTKNSKDTEHCNLKPKVKFERNEYVSIPVDKDRESLKAKIQAMEEETLKRR